jgi:hypothetical protein
LLAAACLRALSFLAAHASGDVPHHRAHAVEPFSARSHREDTRNPVSHVVASRLPARELVVVDRLAALGDAPQRRLDHRPQLGR